MKKYEIIKTEISFAGGFLSCGKDKNQTPHVLEHMILARLQADSSFRKNGKTNGFYVSFSIESISSKHDINLRKLLSAIASPNFTEGDLNRQKSIIRNELLALKNNKKRELFYEVILRQNKNFPDLESQIKSLDNITLSDIEEYYDRFFVLENLTILSSGGESYEKDIEQIILTSGLRKGDRAEIENRFKLDSSFITKDFGSLSKFMGVYSFDFLAGTNNKANFEFLAFILRRKLYYTLRGKGLIYRLSCYVSEGSIFGKSIIILECDFISGNQNSLIRVVEEEISRVSAISKEEFNLLKKEFRDYLIFNSQTPEQNNSLLRIRKFIYGESDDWREFIRDIPWTDYMNLIKNLKQIKIKK